MASPLQPEATELIEEVTEEEWEDAEMAEEAEPEGPATAAEKSRWPAPRQYPRPDEDLPDLPSEQEQIVEAWWEETMPIYRKKDADKMIQRVDKALVEFPHLFVHLGLQEEFLFELGAELGRRGRMADYVALLKRLRREQRQMYSFAYGAYDSTIITELVVTGQGQEIPAYLDFFKEYPDAEPDHCQHICNLLAWRGLAQPLYLLCELVATPMATSSDVLNGTFTLDWLIRREEIPFYEAGDASPEALERTLKALQRLGEQLQLPLEPDRDLLRADLEACTAPPQIDRKGPAEDRAQHWVSMNYLSYLRRVGAIAWVHGFFLADLLQDYFRWCREQQVPRLRLLKKDIEAFSLYRSRMFLSLDGVRLLAVLQMMTWFGGYLQAAGVLSADEAQRIKHDCSQLFSIGRKTVESTDPAYRICPSFVKLTEMHTA